MPSLSPCPKCERHVIVGDAACPFCGHDGPRPAARRRRPRRRRGKLTRAAIFLAGATLASGCGSADPPNNDEIDESMQDIYGGPPVDDDVSEPEDDVGDDALVEAYGAPPPPDDEADSDGEPESVLDEPPVPAYGAPLPPQTPED